MKRIVASEKLNDKFEWLKPDSLDYDQLFDEDVQIVRADGSMLCTLLKKAIPRNIAVQAWPAIQSMNLHTDNRGVASGQDLAFNHKQDGTLSRITRSKNVESGIVGFFERSQRFPYCRACAWNLHNPDKWELLVPLIQHVDQLFKKHEPKRYAQQKAYADKAHQDFIIPKTQFSTLTVNRNFRTAYHKDAGNLAEGISCMTVFRQGKWTGANLVFPAYRVAVKLDAFDMIIFDPHEIHGNTQLVTLSEDAVRCSIVYYFREKIQFCQSAKDELNRVKNRKQGEQLFETKLRKGGKK